LQCIFCIWYSDGVDSTAENSSYLLPNLNAVIAVSEGMQIVKLCFSNKIFQFLTGGAGCSWLTQVDLHNCYKMVVVGVYFFAV